MKDLEVRVRSFSRHLSTTTDRAERREIRQSMAYLVQQQKLIDVELLRVLIYVIRTSVPFWSDSLLESMAIFLNCDTEP